MRITPFLVLILCHVAARLSAADNVIPHAQSKPPGPALSPAEAIAKMTVPEGFSVELVAAEPDIVNPVAMTFDERGRAWITESLEYPRLSAGPGRDRVKVLEDTDGDGRADKFTVFADGLNIPSGIAVGAGGVWVANAPDILFLRDTDGDGKADKREVVVTGFGRDDTHELPNSLTWGPDGWLYGWNGVFNRSVVEQRGKKFDFTAAIFRIHPRTRQFELFCEGTSNPWGIAFDTEGSAFASACVIDHLWHLAETGYYHRQGGPYPPFTWKIESIVKHRHQQAAYCGIHYFDSDAYPEPYRRKLYMGNIHGNCINCDKLARDGSTYVGTAEADFLTANDSWFMPVVQKTGPDGCLYILDWYDRYHCYQDARRDPEGIDRLKGRLYRVRYRDTPRAPKFDLNAESDEQLVARLASGNVFYRDLAQRLLSERKNPTTREKLQALVLDDTAPRPARMHALWALVGGGSLEPSFHSKLFESADPSVRAWAIRAAGNQGSLEPAVRNAVVAAADDPAADVRLQAAIAARKVEGVDALSLLMRVLGNSTYDTLIPHIVWRQLHPQLEDQAERFARMVADADDKQLAGLNVILPRAVERIAARQSHDPTALLALVQALSAEAPGKQAAARQALHKLAVLVQSRELAGEKLEKLRAAMAPHLREALAAGVNGPLYLHASVLSASWGDAEGVGAAHALLNAADQTDERRVLAFEAIVAAGDAAATDAAPALLDGDRRASADARRSVLAALARLDHPRVADVVLASYSQLEAELRPAAIETLTERPAWGKKLLAAIADKRIAADALNVNQVRKLLASGDEELKKQVAATWGSLRTERNPQREQVIGQVRDLLHKTPGDAVAGRAVFGKLCGQCHKIHGQGQEVGPDITLNGRSSFDQLLSNVLDPSLVIGASYEGMTVVTTDGRILTGLLAEDSPQRVVLKLQGGQQAIVARDDVEEMQKSKLSLMPEDIEKQLSPRELADLFAFLLLDKPPEDPQAKLLPGSPAPKQK